MKATRLIRVAFVLTVFIWGRETADARRCTQMHADRKMALYLASPIFVNRSQQDSVCLFILHPWVCNRSALNEGDPIIARHQTDKYQRLHR